MDRNVPSHVPHIKHLLSSPGKNSCCCEGTGSGSMESRGLSCLCMQQGAGMVGMQDLPGFRGNLLPGRGAAVGSNTYRPGWGWSGCGGEQTLNSSLSGGGGSVMVLVVRLRITFAACGLFSKEPAARQHGRGRPLLRRSSSSTVRYPLQWVSWAAGIQGARRQGERERERRVFAGSGDREADVQLWRVWHGNTEVIGASLLTHNPARPAGTGTGRGGTSSLTPTPILQKRLEECAAAAEADSATSMQEDATFFVTFFWRTVVMMCVFYVPMNDLKQRT